MSWWASSEVAQEILKATSSSIPSGEQDLPLNLEIADSVRSKQASVTEVISVLRKRLYDHNPNVQILTLHLIDLLIKNGGNHFFVESVSKEFVDAFIAQLTTLMNQNRNPEVIELMLDYFQTWALASSSKPEAKYLRSKYDELKKRRDITFPDPGALSELSTSFIETETAPEWADSDTCMKSGQPFTFYNRKHHCRNCGGVFLQEYCANFRPLPHFGINIPVRVCDDCNKKLDEKYNRPRRKDQPSTTTSSSRKISSNNRDIGSRYRDDLDQAIKLSLQASKSAQPLEAPNEEDDLDDDMKQAIAASLKELNGTPQQVPQQAPQEQVSQPEQASQQYAPQQEQAPERNRDFDKIDEFYSKVQVASPREVIYNQNLINLNRNAIELQPKIISELRVSSNKLSALEDLHGKLLAVCNYYDKLLEAELDPELQLPKEDVPAQVPTQAPTQAPTEAHTQVPAQSQPEVAQPIYQPQENPRELKQAAAPVAAPAPAAAAAATAAAPEASAAPTEPSAPANESQIEEESEPEPEPILIEL